MKLGLTVGKFAPLHKGHQYLIELALHEVDILIVIIYEALEIPKLTLDLRTHWFKELYPQVIIIKADNVPKDLGWTEEIEEKHEAYIMSLVESYEISAFYSSESYGDRMSKALNCEHRLIDPRRINVPISGTSIRSDLVKYRKFIHPLVLKDLEEIYLGK